MAAAPVYLAHPSSLEHDTGSHPEQPARIRAIERALEDRGWLGYERVASPPAERSALEAVHPARHVEMIERLALAGGAMIDADTIVSEGSYEAALHAAGGAVSLVDRLLDGSAPTGFSAHRPPGHHAEIARAMGFCLFNNIAVAARHAVRRRGLARVMIVDWDVHHGNGTDDIFHEDDAVLFLSIHQSPLYPGTGAASDLGSGHGRGYTVNLPVTAGTGDEIYASLIAHVAVPLARRFAPELVLISAGYDAHASDPLADCLVSEAGYAAMAASLRDVCAEIGAPLGGVLEGGYSLDALGSSVATTLATLAAAPRSDGLGDDGSLAVCDDARRALARLDEFWPGLG